MRNIVEKFLKTQNEIISTFPFRNSTRHFQNLFSFLKKRNEKYSFIVVEISIESGGILKVNG